VASKPNSSNIGAMGNQFSANMDSDSETPAPSQLSYRYTESGTYRGDGNMPSLGKLVVRNGASVASGTIDGRCSSRPSGRFVWEPGLPVDGMPCGSGNSTSRIFEPARTLVGGTGWPASKTPLPPNNDETRSFDEYPQGPKQKGHTQAALLSISPSMTLDIDEFSDEEEAELMKRSVDPNNFNTGEDDGEVVTSDSLRNDLVDERCDGFTELEDTLAVASKDTSNVPQQRSNETGFTMFYTRTPSRVGPERSELLSTATSAIPSAYGVTMDNIRDSRAELSEAPHRRDHLSPAKTSRQLPPPPRPKPHPILAGPRASGKTWGMPRVKGAALLDSADLSRMESLADIPKSSVRANQSNRTLQDAKHVAERNARGYDGSISREGLCLTLTQPNHSKAVLPATADKIPTTISALMLKDLKTPVPITPSLARETEGNVSNTGVPQEAHQSGTQKIRASTRNPPRIGASSIKARIAIFEQAQANNMSDNAYAARSTRSSGKNGT